MPIIARAALAAVAIAFVSNAALAQDATKVDPKHYKVITENAQVRVLLDLTGRERFVVARRREEQG